MSTSPEKSDEQNTAFKAFEATELQALFTEFSKAPHIALAVSGGADSTALAHLTRRWLDWQEQPWPDITILTVDHGLRAGSATEAAWVAKLADKLGFQHQTLTWRGDKPSTSIQEKARAARYKLMSRYCRDEGIAVLALAHTLGDQAETLLMRLARGSGVDGLSSMARTSHRNGVTLIRPFLSIHRARLEQELRDVGQSWLEDPSNRNGRFERIRIRRAMPALTQLGLSPEALGLAALRLQRARQALESVTAEFLKRELTLYEAAYGELRIAALLDASEEIAVRALGRIAMALGGQASPPSLAKIEAALERLRFRPTAFTLSGCQFLLKRKQIVIVREFGRMAHRPTQPSTKARGECGETVSRPSRRLWDQRFEIMLPLEASDDIILRPLGADGLKAALTTGGHFGRTPRAAAMALPSLWRDKMLVFVPCIHFDKAAPESWCTQASARFIHAKGVLSEASVIQE